MVDYFGVTLVVLSIVAFAIGARRAWGAGQPWVKWIGTIGSGLVVVVALAILIVVTAGYAKLHHRYDNPVPTISVDATPERLARGERLAVICAGCHSADGSLPLGGHDLLSEADGPPIGRFFAPNLTPTHLGDWSDGEIIRAIREGIHRNGRSLLVMPSSALQHLSDEDVAALVAYLRSQPPVEPDTPSPRFNLLGAAMINIAPIFEAQPPITEPVVAPAPGVTAEYGAYLTSFTCTGCHGQDLGGNADVGSPGLVVTGAAWSEGDFLAFFETGTKPDGAVVNGQAMPWQEVRRLFNDDELRAMWRGLQERFGAP